MQTTVRIADEKLWSEFHPNTEMIVSRKGRAIFPKLAFNVAGLLAHVCYAITIHFERCDDSKYKFHNGVWVKWARAGPASKPQIIPHPEGIKCGEEWMKTPICFADLKITNNINSTEPMHYVLRSMHKYRPVLTIHQMGPDPYNMVPEASHEFCFAIAEFIAVTAYQNTVVSRLKTENNKFARKRKTILPSIENPAKRAPLPAATYYHMAYNTEPNYCCAQNQTYPMATAAYWPGQFWNLPIDTAMID